MCHHMPPASLNDTANLPPLITSFRLSRSYTQVESGDRAGLIDQYFSQPRERLGEELLAHGNSAFERLSHLLADLDEPHPLVLTIVEDSPGTLSTVLAEFAASGVNLRSIQSVRAKDGSVRFHLCLDRPAEDPAVGEVGASLTAKGLIKLWDSSM